VKAREIWDGQRHGDSKRVMAGGPFYGKRIRPDFSRGGPTATS
jgi:hypothetical protein